MAFVDPILIPETKEKEWSQQISNIFIKQLDIHHEIPPVSIFLVPEVIKKHKPEAYEPQQIGLGPNYHFKPSPYKKMEQRKLTAMRRILEACNKSKDFKEGVRRKVFKRVCDIRGCYDMFLQDADDFLAWIFTIDGLFLLFLFHSYGSIEESGDESHENERKSKEPKEHIVSVEADPRKRLFAQDLMMVENQIPFTVLKEIYTALNSPSDSSIHSDYDFAGIIYRSFCDSHSPLELCPRSEAPREVEHLLQYMYHSIVNHAPHLKIDNGVQPQELATSVPRLLDHSESNKKKNELARIPSAFKGATSLGNFGSPVFTLVQKVPWEKFLPLYEQAVTSLETFSKNRTEIYSASELIRAGFKFLVLPKIEGLWKIDSEAKKIYLPCVTLHMDSEVILRNLVVYEMLTVITSESFPLTEYKRLMCGLIMNVNDVKVLKREKIIQGDLREDEIVKLFTGMRTSIPDIKTGSKSKLQLKIKEVNTIYESQQRMLFIFLKKLASWLLVGLKAIAFFAGSLLKIVAFIISLLTVFLLTSQAYCEAYGCGKTKVSLLKYAPF